MVYFVVKNARNLQHSDTANCMLKLFELGNSHKSRGGDFEVISDRGRRIETLY